MTTKDFKRLVRARMAKTGESYSIARMHLMQQQPTGSGAPAPSPPSRLPTADELWSHLQYDREDITHEVLKRISETVVDRVRSGEHRVGYTELSDLMFRRVNHTKGTAEFHVVFTAEHLSEDFSFDGYVEGSITFDVAAAAKDKFLKSISVVF